MSASQPLDRSPSHTAMNRDKVNALFCLTLNDFEEVFHLHLSKSFSLLGRLNSCFINGNRSNRDRRMANDLLTDRINISARAQVHHTLGPGLNRALKFF